LEKEPGRNTACGNTAASPDSGLPGLSTVELSQAGESIRVMRGWSFWEIDSELFIPCGSLAWKLKSWSPN